MTTTSAPSSWLTMREVCERLRTSEDVVRERMQETDATPVAKCWINKGAAGAKRPTLQFKNVEAVDRWWWEINEWRASENSRAARSDGRSDGSTGHSANPPPKHVPRQRRRASSSSASKPARTSASGTNQNRSAFRFLSSGKS